MTPSGTVQIVCIDPACLSDRVESQDCGGFGWMHCRKCGARWNEEEEDQHDRSPHKVKKVRGEM